MTGIEEWLAAGVLGALLIGFTERFIAIVPSYVLFPMMGLATDPPDIVPVMLSVSLGSAAGAACWYGLGRLLGPVRTRRLVERHGRWIFLNVGLYDRMARSYREQPFRYSLIGQAIPVVRIWQAVPAGVLAVDFRSFLTGTALGALLWNGGWMALGAGLHGGGASAMDVAPFILAAMVVIEGSFFLYAWRRRARRAAANDGCEAG